VIKICKNSRKGLNAPGLAFVAEKLVLVEVKFDTNTTGGSSSLKLDRHDPKHSYKLHVYK
jgi:hypothetical protein